MRASYADGDDIQVRSANPDLARLILIRAGARPPRVALLGVGRQFAFDAETRMPVECHCEMRIQQALRSFPGKWPIQWQIRLSPKEVRMSYRPSREVLGTELL